MKAIAINHYGASNQFELMDLKLRGIQADEVVIDVRAAGVNPVDWKLRRGDLRHQFNWELPIVLGWDVAGIVSEIGSDVANVKVGDAVFARPDMSNRGAYAEQTIVKANKVVVKPINLSFEEAAAVPLTAITAWQVIHKRLKVRKGEAVLIQAGAGGIGIFAIQFAHQLGAPLSQPRGLRMLNSWHDWVLIKSLITVPIALPTCRILSMRFLILLVKLLMVWRF